MPYRIIVADPSPSIQKSFQMVFPESDFKLYFFENGNDLVKALPEIRPDTILLGLDLADKGALEVGRHLSGHEEFKKIPLFFLKGTFEHFDTDRASVIPYDGIIQKPFDSEKLVTTVVEAIDRKITPPTLPEEPTLENAFPDPSVAGPEKNRSPEKANSPEIFWPRIREMVKSEILDMERELEKRVKTRVAAELKEWLLSAKKEPLP